VYAWENRVVAPRDPTTISFPEAQRMADAIWADMGLRYPPRVEPLPAQATATIATATRLSLQLPAQTPSWCLLHELAHAMSGTHDGQSDGHGPIFMGLYVQLLVRYLRLDQAEVLRSLRDAGISVVPGAVPVFWIPSRS
jgi:hypothetical protein